MYLIYNILLAIGSLFLLPRLLREPKYRASLNQRLGKLPKFKSGGKPVLWLHCVSVGETQAARPLVNKIFEEFPDYCLVVSTTTQTGQELAKKLFADQAALIFYFPFDWKFSVERALRLIKPNLVLLMESELWFNFLRESNRRGVRVFVVNGRISEKSARRYAWLKNFMRRALGCIDLALMQSNADAQRIINLGMRAAKVRVTGNIKFDQQINESESGLTEEFRRRFGIGNDAPLIIAASTHAPEEKLILEAFNRVWKSSTGALPRLMLVPRHPERFAEVVQAIKHTGFSWVKRSENPSARDKSAEIILLDSIGELRAVYALGEIIFVGGSLIPHGGQNILEPSIARKAIVTGSCTTNFEAIVKEFLSKDAVIQLPELEEENIAEELAEVFTGLLHDDERRKRLAENAYRVMMENRGATVRTIEQLKPIFQVHISAFKLQK